MKCYFKVFGKGEERTRGIEYWVMFFISVSFFI